MNPEIFLILQKEEYFGARIDVKVALARKEIQHLVAAATKQEIGSVC